MSRHNHLIDSRSFLAAGISAPGFAPMAYPRALEASPNEEIAMGTKQALNWDSKTEKARENAERAKSAHRKADPRVDS